MHHRLAQGVGQNRTHADRAPVHIEQWVDRLHRGLENPARKRIKLQLHGLARPQFVLVALGQPEVHIHAADVFQVDQVGTILDVVAQVDVANANCAIERRDDRHPRLARARQCQLRLGHLQIGRTLFQHALGYKTLRHQFLVAPEVGLRDGDLGLGLLYLGPLQRIVELYQHLTPAHRRTVREPQLTDPACHLRTHHHALTRAQRPDRLGIIAQGGTFCLCDLHAGGARRGTRTSGWGGRRRPRCARRANFVWTHGLGLVPPGSTRSRCDADNRHGGVDYF